VFHSFVQNGPEVAVSDEFLRDRLTIPDIGQFENAERILSEWARLYHAPAVTGE